MTENDIFKVELKQKNETSFTRENNVLFNSNKSFCNHFKAAKTLKAIGREYPRTYATSH